MKPSPIAPPGATARPRAPHPHPDEGPASRVPGAPPSDPSCAADPPEPPGSPPSLLSSPDDLRALAAAVARLGQDVDDPAQLSQAPLADVLFWALAADRSDVAGVPGSVIAGVRGDLDVLIGFVEQHQMGGRDVVAAALFRLRRRLDAAYELLAILARPAWQAANDPHPRNGGAVLYELPASPRR